jgi:hypothetical protein
MRNFSQQFCESRFDFLFSAVTAVTQSVSSEKWKSAAGVGESCFSPLLLMQAKGEKEAQHRSACWVCQARRNCELQPHFDKALP